MRRVTATGMVGLLVVLGGWWFSTLPKASMETESIPPLAEELPPRPAIAAGETHRPVQARDRFEYDSPEVRLAMDNLMRVLKPGGYAVDAWRFPDCNVVTVFYLSFENVEEAGWFWFDLHEKEFTRVLRLPNLLSTLSRHIPDIGPLRHPDISIVHESDEPRYHVARAGARGQLDVEIRFAESTCDRVPSQVFLRSPSESIPVPVDLAVEIQAVLGRP